MLLGAALRVGWLLVAHPEPVSDFLGYRSLASRWLTTGQYARLGVPTAYRTPGYPAFLALGLWVSKANWWLSLINVALSTAAIPLTALFASRLGFGRRTVIVSAGLIAVLPTYVFFAPVLASEHLQLVLVLGAWCSSLRTTSRSRAVVAGLAYGVAILVRPESLFFLFAAPWLIRLAVPSWSRIARLAGVTALVAGLVVVPWYVRNEVAVGRGAGISTTGGLNLYLAHNSEPGTRFVPLDQTPLRGLDELATNRKGLTLGLRNIRSDPLGLVTATWNHTYERIPEPHVRLVLQHPQARAEWLRAHGLRARGLRGRDRREVELVRDRGAAGDRSDPALRSRRGLRRARDALPSRSSSRTGSVSPSCSGACRGTATRSNPC